MAVDNTQAVAVKDAILITQTVGKMYLQLKSANQRLNGVEDLKSLPLVDIQEQFPYLSGLTQADWDGICHLVGIVFGEVDGQFAAVAKVWELPPL